MISTTDSPAGSDSGVAGTWRRFWFAPADPRPLAVVRPLAALLGLILAGSYAADLERWFGPAGMIPPRPAAAWRVPFSVSLYDGATEPSAIRGLFAATLAAFAALGVGLGTRVAAPTAAILWASLLHRGPMLAGPADDCLAVLLWCLAVGPCGSRLSIDRWLAGRAGRRMPEASAAAAVSLGLVKLHAAAIAAAAALAQLKGAVWWDGTAAWWLAGRAGSLVDPTPLYVRSVQLMNLVSHAVVGFEILFAAGLWFSSTARDTARAGLVGWPVVGLLAGEPWWGLTLAVFCVPTACFTARNQP